MGRATIPVDPQAVRIPSSWQMAGSVWGLTVLAVAHPVLDLLGRNAAFFVARDASWQEPVGLAVAMTALLPMAAVGLLTMWRRLHARSAAYGHLVLLGGLTLLIAVQVLDRALWWRPPLSALVTFCVVVAALGVWAYRRSPSLRAVLSLGWLLPPIVVALFLFVSPVSALILQEDPTAPSSFEFTRSPSIVMIVLDELPVVSLMRADGRVDADLFPTFARLSEDGAWYRNTTTVDTFTTQAVPAMLTGRYPTDGQLPIAADHPDSLFSILGGTYRVHAVESLTQLCPAGACQTDGAPDQSASQRLRTLASDVVIVTAHALSPEQLRVRLPELDGAWGGFGGAGASSSELAEINRDAVRKTLKQRAADQVEGDRHAAFRDFAGSIATGPDEGSPSLFFLHSMLPHTPWEYLPSGRAYFHETPVPGRSEGGGWAANEWLINQSRQRHMLQLGMVDRMIAEVVRVLETAQRYDDTLIVVTADHGIAFEPRTDRRAMTAFTIGDIASVPLFIKYPGSQVTGIIDEPVETVDIVPTVLEVLGASADGASDGQSLIDPHRRHRTQRRVSQRGEVMKVAADGRDRDAALDRKLRVFGPDGGVASLYGFGVHGDLVGRRVIDIGVDAAEEQTMVVTLDQAAQLRDVELDGRGRIPALLTGEVHGLDDGDTYIAVAVDGVVRSVTKVFDSPSGQLRWSAMLPESVLVQGDNEVNIYEIREQREPALVPIEVRPS